MHLSERPMFQIKFVVHDSHCRAPSFVQFCTAGNGCQAQSQKFAQLAVVFWSPSRLHLRLLVRTLRRKVQHGIVRVSCSWRQFCAARQKSSEHFLFSRFSCACSRPLTFPFAGGICVFDFDGFQAFDLGAMLLALAL